MGLRLNFIFASPGMSGGVKSSKLIAEAMGRRGHDVRLCFPTLRRANPKGRLAELLKKKGEIERPATHHLTESTVERIAVEALDVGPEHVPEADFSIASWWMVRERMESWPRELGEPVHYIRHHEVFARNAERAKAVYRLPGKKVAIARWLISTVERTYGQTGIAYIPNGIDREQFSSPPRSASEPRTLGFLYSRKAWKNCPLVYDAIRELRRRGHTFNVKAFGSDFPLAGEAFPPDITLDYLPRQDRIAQIYRGIDCWAVTSDFEGLGMTGLEAAACGCPLVSTRSGGPEDYTIHGRNGELVPAKDAPAMTDAIERVLFSTADDWGRMSRESLEISEEFDWDRSAQRLEAFLEGRS